MPAAPRRWDPQQWAAMYDSQDGGGRAFIFRNGAELARRACLTRASPGEHWVDVGCGTGHLAAALEGAGLHVAGLDSDWRMVHAAQTRFANGDASRQLRFEVAEADHLPFGDGAADGVVATSLVACLDDPQSFFRELARVLRPGGSAVITFSNRTRLRYVPPRIRRFDPSASLEYARLRRFTRAQAARMLEAAGLTVDELRYYNCFLSTAKHMVPPRRLAIGLERIANLSSRAGALVARNFMVIASQG